MKNNETEWISRYLNTPVEITTDLSLICEYEYDQELAKCHIANYGHIYYYTETCEPLDVEEVENILSEFKHSKQRDGSTAILFLTLMAAGSIAFIVFIFLIWISYFQIHTTVALRRLTLFASCIPLKVRYEEIVKAMGKS